ncbi:MAG: polysaccharide pyruvyl transferase family protein [Clostridia bacterium]
MNKKIFISVGTIKSNKGSEALVRGLLQICRKEYPKATIVLCVMEEIETSEIEEVDKIIKRYSFENKSIKRYVVAILRKFFRLENWSNQIKYNKVLKEIGNSDIIISIGADNYDKSYHMIDSIHEYHKIINQYRKKDSKFILYDCSIAKEDIGKKEIADFSLFDEITVRESLSFVNVESKIDKKKVHYYPDPAFIMEPKMQKLPKEWKKGHMIGLNLSNLITKQEYGGNYEMIMGNYRNLITYILKNTKENIVLIPHVMKNADLSTLKLLYQEFKESNRVILVDDEQLSAPEIKYIISNCELFIGARTHSTIAAYSSYVPTLVLGYSIKSIGIATDLFGDSQKYVIPVSSLKEKNLLVQEFQWLQNEQENIKKHLKERIPQYIEDAYQFGNLLK